MFKILPFLMVFLAVSCTNTPYQSQSGSGAEKPLDKKPEISAPAHGHDRRSEGADELDSKLPEISAPAIGQIKFSPVKNYTKDELEVLGISEQLANQLVKSQCFAQVMESRGLIQTDGKTPKEVVEHIKTARLSVPVTMYYKWGNVVGYRNPGDPTVYTNRRFHAGATACSRASNLTHEWSHVLGYGHDFKATVRRPKSVPYSINFAFQKCCSCEGIKNCKILQ